MNRVMPFFRRALCPPNQPDDAALLAAFTAGGDDDAFALLVRRHGPLVYGVCRRCLGNGADVEDAFQATFLVLVRRAQSIERPQQLANWLYGVALRASRKLRDRSVRLRRLEGARPDLTRWPAAEPADADLAALLDSELRRLPEKYRVPVILCHLQGLSRREAADRLGCPEGTLSVRLARALNFLRTRLTRRGLALPAAGLAVVLAGDAKASVPRLLVHCTVQTACRYLSQSAVPVSGRAATLAEGVLRMFLVKRIFAASTALAVALAVGLGGTLLVRHAADSSAIAADGPGKTAPPPLKLTVADGAPGRKLTLREGDDEVEMKTPGALSRYLKRVRLDRTAPSDLTIVTPENTKVADIADVLLACQDAGFLRITMERVPAAAVADARKEDIVQHIDELIARSRIEQDWKQLFNERNFDLNPALIEKAKGLYDQALKEMKEGKGSEGDRKRRLDEAKSMYDKTRELLKTFDPKAAESARYQDELKRYYEKLQRQRKDDESERQQEDQKRLYDQSIDQAKKVLGDKKKTIEDATRQEAVNALKSLAEQQFKNWANPPAPRDMLQGRWRAVMIHDNGKAVRDEAALKKFEWLIVGDYLITSHDGGPRLGTIELSKGQDDETGLRFNYDREAKSPFFTARYRVEGDSLTVVIPGKEPGQDTIIVFKRVAERKQPY
ncbi:MAG: sigma-70 family RNA polymerase sigma factor [Gemmataceae bacterium]